MTDHSPVAPPADLTRRLSDQERRTERLESDVRHLVTSMETLGGQITALATTLEGFGRDIHTRISGLKDSVAARSETDWKALLGAASVLVALGTAATAGAVWLVMTVEGLRADAIAERISAEVGAREASAIELGRQIAAAEAHRAEIDRIIIEQHRRDHDALDARLSRLEAAHLERAIP